MKKNLKFSDLLFLECYLRLHCCQLLLRDSTGVVCGLQIFRQRSLLFTNSSNFFFDFDLAALQLSNLLSTTNDLVIQSDATTL